MAAGKKNTKATISTHPIPELLSGCSAMSGLLSRAGERIGGGVGERRGNGVGPVLAGVACRQTIPTRSNFRLGFGPCPERVQGTLIGLGAVPDLALHQIAGLLGRYHSADDRQTGQPADRGGT